MAIGRRCLFRVCPCPFRRDKNLLARVASATPRSGHESEKQSTRSMVSTKNDARLCLHVCVLQERPDITGANQRWNVERTREHDRQVSLSFADPPFAATLPFFALLINLLVLERAPSISFQRQREPPVQPMKEQTLRVKGVASVVYVYSCVS